jgi:hypothetical protein
MHMSLTLLGTIHTGIALVAVAAALFSLVLHRGIRPEAVAGRVYLSSLVLTCLTGFPIFRHGGISPPHILGVLVLATLGIAWLAGLKPWRLGPYLRTGALSFSVLLLSISTVTETLTRLPIGAPWVTSPESPALKPIYGLLLLAFAAGLGLQWLSLTRRSTGGALQS